MNRLGLTINRSFRTQCARYGKAAAISKDDIFAYVYAVLHDPVYRETYALNLKREFPRIPLLCPRTGATGATDFSERAAAAREKLVSLLTSFIFHATAGHTHVGAAFELVSVIYKCYMYSQEQRNIALTRRQTMVSLLTCFIFHVTAGHTHVGAAFELVSVT